MEHDSTAASTRMRQAVNNLLMVVGLVLFVFFGGKAIDQANDRKYVEGTRQSRHVAAASGQAGDLDLAGRDTLPTAQHAVQRNVYEEDNSEEDKPAAPSRPTPQPARSASAKAPEKARVQASQHAKVAPAHN
jgi:hypothetical protein